MDYMKNIKTLLVISLLMNAFMLGLFLSKIEKHGGMKNSTEMVADLFEKERELTPWELMELGLIKVECEGNPLAVSSVGARGIFQITPIYVKEVNRLSDIHNLGVRFTFDDAFDIGKSFEMFNIMNTYHNTADDEYERISNIIKKHNPKAGDWYAKRVYKAMFEIMMNEDIKNEYIGFLDYI